MTLTTERLKWLHDAATELSATKLKMTMRPDELLVLTSELLANREAQPLYQYRMRNPYNRQVTDWETIKPEQVDFILKETIAANVEFRIIAATPAPAVPGELLDAMEEVISISDRDHVAWDKAKAAITACRAAMLAQPVSSGYKLQDGWIACSERMPDADGAYWCWFGKEKPSVIQQRVCIWNDRNHEWCDSSVTHWMPLPAAPEGGNG